MPSTDCSHYSFKWASGVVQDLYARYPRAQIVFENITGLSHNQMAFILATRQDCWIFLRNSLKELDTVIKIMGNIHRGKRDLLNRCVVPWLRRVQPDAPEAMKSWWTGLLKGATIKEQSVEGLPDGLRAGGKPSLQLLLFKDPDDARSPHE